MWYSRASTLLLLATSASAASPWTFAEGSVTVSSPGSDESSSSFAPGKSLNEPIPLGLRDSLKISLTTHEGSKAKRPHQAFVVLKESSGLDSPFPLKVKESGKATVVITQKDLPIQLLTSNEPLEANVVLGSFGSVPGSVIPIFNINVQPPSQGPSPTVEKPLRYGKLPEIHHIFRADPKSPPKFVSMIFSLAVVATVPALFISWFALGANVSHISKALSSAPISHASFFLSIVGMEGVFFLYYAGWNLFQTLPVMAAVGVGAFLSGSRALGEVRRRRLAGER